MIFSSVNNPNNIRIKLTLEEAELWNILFVVGIEFLYIINELSKKEIKENNSIYNNIRKDKILRHKFNQIRLRLVHWKL